MIRTGRVQLQGPAAELSMASHHPLSILENGNRQDERKTQNGLLFRGIFAIIPETTTLQ